MTASDDFEFRVEDVFHLTGRDAPVVTGVLRTGHVSGGDEISVVNADGSQTERGVVVTLEIHGGPGGRLGLMIGGAAVRLLAPGSTIYAACVDHRRPG